MEAHHTIENSFVEQFKSIKDDNTKLNNQITNYQEKVHSITLKVSFFVSKCNN
jgi:hypothetical protein